MTDNGPAYRSIVWADTLESVDIDHVLTRPYRPQTNGKVERYQRTLTTQWATDNQRADNLRHWLHQYNHHRYHTAIDAAPITRVNNLPDHYT